MALEYPGGSEGDTTYTRLTGCPFCGADLSPMDNYGFPRHWRGECPENAEAISQSVDNEVSNGS